MGRRVTWLVVGAVAALAVAAAVEALRGEPEARPTPTTTPERRQAASARPAVAISGQEGVRALLEAAGASGVLYFGDRTCRLRTLLLPAAQWRPEPNRPVPCRFTVDPGGAVHPGEVRVEPESGLRAVCHESGIDVFDRAWLALASFPGACAPAWRADGSLSFVRDGELVLVPNLRDEHVLLSRADVTTTLRAGSRLLEAAWFDDDTYAAAVRRGRETRLAVFRGNKLVARPTFSSPRIDELRTTGRVVAARTGTSGPAITFLSRTGREILTVQGGHSVSWSPRGAVAAVAGRAVVVFVDPATRVRAPLALIATDLEWR
jgi:hypothetical protein